jgi:hypothetical protein
VGIKDFKVFGTNSPTAFANVSDYADETDLTLLGSVTAREHIPEDIEDEQFFPLITGNFRYVVLKIANNHGSGSYMGFRHAAVSFGDSANGLAVTFSPRNRIEQTGSSPIPQTTGDITSEPDVLYNVVCTDADTLAVLYSAMGSPVSSHSIPILEKTSRVNVTVESVRNGTISHQKHEHTFTLVGYGKSYGISYGGKD